ncbi:putative immune-type receptor 16 precursor, partial [Clarias magur]
PAQSVDFQRPSFLLLRPGEHVTLHCPFGDTRQAESVVWYKHVLGEMPQKVGERLAYEEHQIYPEFKRSGFTIDTTDNSFSLTIPHMQKEHGGLYYCGKCNIDDVALSNGTFLSVTDDKGVKVAVFQSGVSDSVPAGASVTVQCSVLSESRAAELQVLWFRAAPPQSHPQIIYTHHNSGHQCESGSPTHTCVYNFSKNILSLSDTGTYYCAVAACGKIIFGNGTRVQLENVAELVRPLGPEVIYLGIVVAVCVVVIFIQAFIICKIKSCEQSRVKSYQGSLVETAPNS